MANACELLDDEALAALRHAYDRDTMIGIARNSVACADPHAERLVGFVVEELYQTTRMTPVERERCLVCFFAGKGSPGALGIHIYWGLMEGLTVDGVLQAVLLGGVYGGLDHYTASARTVNTALGILAEHAAEGGDALSVASVGGALWKALG